MSNEPVSSPTTERELWMVGELRRSLGMFDGAMPISPAVAWQQAIDELGRRLQLSEGRPCVFWPSRCHCRPDLPTYHHTAAAE